MLACGKRRKKEEAGGAREGSCKPACYVQHNAENHIEGDSSDQGICLPKRSLGSAHAESLAGAGCRAPGLPRDLFRLRKEGAGVRQATQTQVELHSLLGAPRLSGVCAAPHRLSQLRADHREGSLGLRQAPHLRRVPSLSSSMGAPSLLGRNGEDIPCRLG